MRGDGERGTEGGQREGRDRRGQREDSEVRIAGDSGRTQERRGQSEDNRGGQMGRGRTERGYLTGSTILVHRNWGVIKYVNQPGEVCHSLQLQQR